MPCLTPFLIPMMLRVNWYAFNGCAFDFATVFQVEFNAVKFIFPSIVTMFTEGLMVAIPPKDLLIPSMGLDMIHNGRGLAAPDALVVGV